MKVFIVFLGLLIINLSFLSYHEDMSRYIQAQTFLKALAEECAAGASLYYDEEKYSEGKMIFLYDECRKYTEATIEESKSRMPFSKDSGFQYQISYEDDLHGSGEIPAVIVEIKVNTEDLFRLPFLEWTEITRKAKYELVSG